MIVNQRPNGIENIKWDYLLVCLLLANSGIPFFYLNIEFKIINFIIVCIVFFFRNKTVEKYIFIYIFMFTIIYIGQCYTFNSFIYQDYLSVIIRILIAYLTIRTVSLRFFSTYINLIYVFAIISFFFYLPAIIVPGITNIFASKISPFFHPLFNYVHKYMANNQVIIFNFNEIGDLRNSGPFWEPTTFGGFLLIAIIINTVMSGLLIVKKNIIMMIALLTTLSTTIYIAFFLFIMIYFVFINKTINAIVTIIPLFAVFLIIFFEAGFLQNKIKSQINETDKYYHRGQVENRFVSALVDINDFLKYPVFGKGNGEIGEKLNSRFNEHRSNGLATYLAEFGLIFFLFYFLNLYLSLNRFCSLYENNKHLSYLLFFILILIGFSEQYYNLPFFYALTLLHVTIPSRLLKYLEFKKVNDGLLLSSQ
jgi:hypothetical protein